MIKVLEAKVQELGQSSLRSSSVPVLIQALKECNVNTMWIQEEPELDNWDTKPEMVDEVMIGDTEYEVSIASNTTMNMVLTFYSRLFGAMESNS